MSWPRWARGCSRDWCPAASDSESGEIRIGRNLVNLHSPAFGAFQTMPFAPLAAGRRRAAEFTIERMARATLAVYREALLDHTAESELP